MAFFEKLIYQFAQLSAVFINCILCSAQLKLKKDRKAKGCGGGNDVCRFLAAYGTVTKAEQLPQKVLK